MIKFKNFTPHSILLNDGTEYPSEGIARVANAFTEFDNTKCCHVEYGEVGGLPNPEEGVMLIVSAMVLTASDREDLVAPATGHPDTVRDSQGRIVSVPGFVQK